MWDWRDFYPTECSSDWRPELLDKTLVLDCAFWFLMWFKYRISDIIFGNKVRLLWVWQPRLQAAVEKKHNGMNCAITCCTGSMTLRSWYIKDKMETAPMMETKMALRPDLWSALDSFECNSTEMTYLEQIKVSLDTFPSRRTPGGVYVTDIFCGDWPAVSVDSGRTNCRHQAECQQTFTEPKYFEFLFIDSLILLTSPP